MSEENTVSVTVSYRDVKVVFTGEPLQVLSSTTSFLSKEIPSLDLAHRISLNYSVSEMIELFSDNILITPEGPRVWYKDGELSDKVVIGLQLVASKIAKILGKTPRSNLSLQEIESLTSLKTKSISSRISEMSKLGYIEKEQRDHLVAYGLTTIGVKWLSGTLHKQS
ncbi:MAG: hypothetical protein IH932_03260 [Thaumarchaeota archaeon]|nr:hypothetical protein [Nitrososphaerota archaeon]